MIENESIYTADTQDLPTRQQLIDEAKVLENEAKQLSIKAQELTRQSMHASDLAKKETLVEDAKEALRQSYIKAKEGKEKRERAQLIPE